MLNADHLSIGTVFDFVNVARGTFIDEVALVARLDNGSQTPSRDTAVEVTRYRCPLRLTPGKNTVSIAWFQYDGY